jgi:hypothetical protein
LNADYRRAAVGGGKLAVQHQPPDGGAIAEDPHPLGLAQLIIVLVMIKQNRTPGRRLLHLTVVGGDLLSS